MPSGPEEPVVHVLNGVVRPDKEGGFRRELTEVNGDVEHLPDHAFGVGQQREREVAECILASSSVVPGPMPTMEQPTEANKSCCSLNVKHPRLQVGELFLE